MSKVIIHNETGFQDHEVLGLVSEVIAGGRISGDGEYYCYATVFQEIGVVVYSRKNPQSDTFYVRRCQDVKPD